MSKNNNFKCAECLKTEPEKYNKPVGGVFYPYKGQNNTELCHRCGGEKCYSCGKNSKSFIHLFEKSSDNSVSGWHVCYCEECFLNRPKKFQDIGEPSKKLENNNSNNSQKNDSVTTRYVTEEEINALIFGSQPRNHTDKEKSNIGICDKCNVNYEDTNCWYYITVKDSVERKKIDNFCPNCWKTEEKNYRYISNRNNTVYKLDKRQYPKLIGNYYYFENNKWIDLDSGKPNNDLEQSDSKNNDNKNPQDLVKNPNKRVIINSLLDYFKNKGIKQILLTPEGNLTIKYNSTMFLNDKNDNELTDQTIINSDKLSQELQEVKNYLQANQKQSLSQQELMNTINSTSISPENPKNNNALKIGLALGIGGTLLFGIMIILVIRKKTNQKLKYR